MSLQAIIEEVQTLSLDEQKQLIKVLVDIVSEPASQMASQLAHEPAPKTRSLRELRGLGKAVWAGIDAQEYIDQQRDEWDNPR